MRFGIYFEIIFNKKWLFSCRNTYILIIVARICWGFRGITIQYYTEKGGRAVYLLLLDASKAFDKVSYEKLFELLLARNVCPKIVKLLYYMYTHQKCHVRWNNKQSDPFSVSNGVKQGSVISPLLFSIYIDNLFSKLKQLGLGCHVGFWLC